MNYPLLFSYRGPVIGPKFLAEVMLRGRLLASVEPEGWWLYGVNPGALAVDGKSLDEADCQLKETMHDVLVGFAEEAESFDDFKRSVEEYFYAVCEPVLQEWTEAVANVRSSPTIKIEGLPKKPADSDMFVRVTKKAERDMSAADNVADSNLLAAA